MPVYVEKTGGFDRLAKIAVEKTGGFDYMARAYVETGTGPNDYELVFQRAAIYGMAGGSFFRLKASPTSIVSAPLTASGDSLMTNASGGRCMASSGAANQFYVAFEATVTGGRLLRCTVNVNSDDVAVEHGAPLLYSSFFPQAMFYVNDTLYGITSSGNIYEMTVTWPNLVRAGRGSASDGTGSVGGGYGYRRHSVCGRR